GDVLPSRRAHDEELVDRHAVLRGKAFGYSRRHILRIECGGLWRTDDLALDVVLFQTNTRAGGYQPPGSAESDDFRSISELFNRQIFVKYYLKFLGRARNHAGGDLFATDFGKELGEGLLNAVLYVRSALGRRF